MILEKEWHSQEFFVPKNIHTKEENSRRIFLFFLFVPLFMHKMNIYS